MRHFCFAASAFIRTATGVVALTLASLIGSAAHATPIVLQTPAGLNPGDHFRFAFMTAGLTTATSGDIGTCNTFVNTQARGATYSGSAVAWKALASTSTVDARDNIGGVDSAVAVYLVTGVKVAGDMTANAANDGLWSGSLYDTIAYDVDGTALNAYQYVFTGSLANGVKDSTTYFGASSVMAGSPAFHSAGTPWWVHSLGNIAGFTLPMYAVSSELTVPSAVPEIDPAGASSVLALVAGALGLLERRTRRKFA